MRQDKSDRTNLIKRHSGKIRVCNTIYGRVIVAKFLRNINYTIHYNIENYTVRRIIRNLYSVWRSTQLIDLHEPAIWLFFTYISGLRLLTDHLTNERKFRSTTSTWVPTPHSSLTWVPFPLNMILQYIVLNSNFKKFFKILQLFLKLFLIHSWIQSAFFRDF